MVEENYAGGLAFLSLSRPSLLGTSTFPGVSAGISTLDGWCLALD